MPTNISPIESLKGARGRNAGPSRARPLLLRKRTEVHQQKIGPVTNFRKGAKHEQKQQAPISVPAAAASIAKDLLEGKNSTPFDVDRKERHAPQSECGDGVYMSLKDLRGDPNTVDRKTQAALNEADAFERGEKKLREIAKTIVIDVKEIRERTGLTQEGFAKAYGIPLATLKNWEQGRRKPDLASCLLLKLIDGNPGRVAQELGSILHAHRVRKAREFA